MCYSVESSLRTSGMSFLAIIYLLSSGIPKFQYLGVVLIGWSIMQLAEAFLWMTYPRKCNSINKWITIIIIPIVLIMQPLGSVWGSLFLHSWNENKQFIINYSAFIILFLLCHRYIFNPLFFTYKLCTTITPRGHLDWDTKVATNYNYLNLSYILSILFWGFVILYPLLKFWKGNRLWPFYIIPFLGMIIGFFTDSPGSIWCHITSYASITAAVCLFLNNIGIKILN